MHACTLYGVSLFLSESYSLTLYVSFVVLLFTNLLHSLLTSLSAILELENAPAALIVLELVALVLVALALALALVALALALVLTRSSTCSAAAMVIDLRADDDDDASIALITKNQESSIDR
jgi:hypothetical protein